MQYYDALDERLKILGRTVRTSPMPIFWTAGGVEVRTDSSELWFELESDYEHREEWIRIEVDGFCLQRMMLPKGRTTVCAFRALPMDKVRIVRLLKEVQPAREDEKRFLLFHGLSCDGTLYEPVTGNMKIEVIGDSLSAGEGLGGSPELLSGGAAVYGLTGHYARLVADYFQADLRIMAQSGWGVYTSCFNDRIGIMPKYYEQVCGVVKGEQNRRLGAFSLNDFNAWQPNAVIINLGSNDGFALDREPWVDPETGEVYQQKTNPYGGVEEASAIRFETAVVDFIKKVRKNNPKAYIVWAYGMCDHTMLPYLEKAVAAYKEEIEDERADFLALPATTAQWVGSSNHPGVVTHKLAADVLIEAINEKM